MIVDKEQKFPGIPPRSFQAIYELIIRPKRKVFSQINCYTEMIKA